MNFCISKSELSSRSVKIDFIRTANSWCQELIFQCLEIYRTKNRVLANLIVSEIFTRGKRIYLWLVLIRSSSTNELRISTLPVILYRNVVCDLFEVRWAPRVSLHDSRFRFRDISTSLRVQRRYINRVTQANEQASNSASSKLLSDHFQNHCLAIYGTRFRSLRPSESLVFLPRNTPRCSKPPLCFSLPFSRPLQPR